MKAEALKQGDLWWRAKEDAWVTVLSVGPESLPGPKGWERLVCVTFRYGPAHSLYPLSFCSLLPVDEEVDVRRDENAEVKRFR